MPDTIEEYPDDPTPPEPKPIIGLAAEKLDREFDLKHELVNLNKQRNGDKEAMQALMYELHELMAGAGREGKFTSFLRNDLGWSGKDPYRKAMRWRAAHMFRVGLMDKAAYDKANGNVSSTLRTTSESDEATLPPVPELHQTYTVAVDPSVPPVSQPNFSPEEIGADIASLEQRREGFFVTKLYRGTFPVALEKWIAFGWQQQAKRHGTKTSVETLMAIILLGTKPAEPGNAWEEKYEAILRDIGHDHSLALDPGLVHPDDIGDEQEEGASYWTADDADLVNLFTSTDEPTEIPYEITLDDLDGPPCW